MSKKSESIKRQLNTLKPILKFVPLPLERLFQNVVGDSVSKEHKDDITFLKIKLSECKAELLTPDVIDKDVVILYIHGGGFAVGSIEYARGFGSVLAITQKCNVMTVEYRLAPEHKFPLALDDVSECYEYLLGLGYTEDKIILCGESAGGGLCYSLCHRLKDNGRKLPVGIITISPWTDLTMSAESYTKNKDIDPSMTIEKLRKYASMYTDDYTNKYVSPLFGDFTGFPKHLVIVGENEIMYDDAKGVHNKCLECGVDSVIIDTPNMWHAYVLIDTPESHQDYNEIENFIKEISVGK